MSGRTLVPFNLLTQAGAPTTPTLRAGDLYYDTTLGVLVYTGTAWQQATQGNIDGGTPSTTTFTWTLDGGTA